MEKKKKKVQYNIFVFLIGQIILLNLLDMIYDEDLVQYFWVQMVCGIWEQTS